MQPAPLAVYPVSELVEILRGVLSEAFGTVWVEGEVSSLHQSRAGHVYFDLKDSQALLRAAMFRRSAERSRAELVEGLRVRARASLDVYAARGTLQLIVEDVVPVGDGALRVAFERLRQQLQAEGLFDEAHKQPLPVLPERIGLVTSARGAAIHDFVRALRRSPLPPEVVVYDVRVQGEDAWREVVRGLHLLGADPTLELIVIARGGGSAQDLWTFNREEVVRTIFELRTPVVSAIGHEVDWVLTDLVADARAATPSAAAARIAPDGEEIVNRLRALRRRLRDGLRARLRLERHRLVAIERGLVHPAQRLVFARARLTRASAGLVQATARRIQRAWDPVHQLQRTLVPALERRLAACRVRLERAEDQSRVGFRNGWMARLSRLRAASGRLDALSPMRVLARGYAIARRSSDGAILRSSGQVKPGDRLELRLERGRLEADVVDVLSEGEIE